MSCSPLVPVILAPSTTVQAAIVQLHEAQANAALVVKDQQLLGLFTEQDLIRTIATGLPLAQTQVAAVMSIPSLVLSDVEIGDRDRLKKLFQRHSVDWVPVVNAQGQFIQVISRKETLDLEPLEVPPIFCQEAGAFDHLLLPRSVRSSLQQALYRAEQSNHLLWEIFPNLLIRLARDGTYLDFVPAKSFKSFTPAADLLGKTIFEVMPPDFAQERMSYVELALQTKQTQTYEYSLEFDNEYRYQEAQITASGEDEVLIIVRDITDRKKFEIALRRSEEQLREITNTVRQFLFIRCARTRQYLYVSPAYETLWGRSCDSLYADPESWLAAIHPEDLPLVNQSLDQSIQEQPIVREYRLVRSDGSIRWIRDSLSPVYDKKGQLLRLVGVAEDITDRKRVEEELRISKQHLSLALEAAKAGTWEWSTQHATLWSDACFQLMGYDKTSVKPSYRNWLRSIHPEDRDRVKHEMMQAFNQGNYFRIEYRSPTSDGSIGWLANLGQTSRDREGKLTRAIGILLDITEQKRIEEELRESQRFIQSIADSSPNLLYLYDIHNHRNVYVNRRVEQLLGYTSEEIQSIHPNLLQSLLHPDDFAKLRQKIHHLEKIADGEIIEFEYRVRQKNGEWRWFRSLDTVFERTLEGQPKLLLGTAIDITEHKQAREVIERSEKKYRELVELAGSIILRFDTSGRITFLNEYGQQFFGYSEADILDRQIVGTLVPEVECTGRDLRSLITQFCQDAYHHTLSENENILSNGERVWVQWSNKPIRDNCGRLIEILSVGVDITERKQAQEQLAIAKEAAETASRAKSEFLSMMSHELRTPLTSILGFAEVIAKETSLSAEHQEYLNSIRQSGTQLLSLINSVLEMSRIESGELRCHVTLFDLHQVLKNMEALFQLRAESKGLELIVDWAIDLPQYICTDEDKLRQVLINLLDNAIKFTSAGRIVLRASCSPDESNPEAALLQIEVEDTGTGIAPDEMGVLFHAFVQTESGRSMRQGTGLGLAISHRFVQAMGGSILVQSQEGQGSCFTVMIPCQSEPAQPHLDSLHSRLNDASGSVARLPSSPLVDLPEALYNPKTLPPEWVEQLYHAALRLNSTQCFTLIKQLPNTHASLALQLTQWVDRFQFEDIIAWTNRE